MTTETLKDAERIVAMVNPAVLPQLFALAHLLLETNAELCILRPTPTKPLCPACGDTVLVPLRTLSVKICPTCSHEVAWNLEPGRKPVIEGGRCIK